MLERSSLLLLGQIVGERMEANKRNVLFFPPGSKLSQRFSKSVGQNRVDRLKAYVALKALSVCVYPHE